MSTLRRSASAWESVRIRWSPLSAGRCCRRYCATAIRRRRPERRPVGWSHISHGTPFSTKGGGHQPVRPRGRFFASFTRRHQRRARLLLLVAARTCGPVEEDEPTVVLAHDREPGAQIRTQDLMLSERVAIESPHPGLRPWRTRTSMRGLGRDLISATSDLNRGPPGRDAGGLPRALSRCPIRDPPPAHATRLQAARCGVCSGKWHGVSSRS